MLGLYVGIGLLLIAFNLRVGIASVSPVLPYVQRDLHGPFAVSLLTTIPVVAFGAFAFVTPWLTRRVGLHRLLGITMAIAGAGILLRMLPSTAALFAGTIVLGAAIAVGNVCMPAAIKNDFAHRTGLMMALYTTSLFVGAAVAAAFTVPLLNAFQGSWRAALGFWVVPAAVAFAFWVPRALKSPVQGAQTHIVEDVPHEFREEPSLARLFRDRVAWAVTGFMGLQSLTYYAALTWVPTLLQDGGVTSRDAGLLLSYTSVPGVAAALGVSILGRIRHTWLPVALATAALMIGFGGLLITVDGNAAWVWMSFLGIGQGASIALSLQYIVQRSPDAQHTGHVSTMAQGTGYLFAGLGPSGIGILHSATGGWFIPIGVVILVLIPQFILGAAASRNRHVLTIRSRTQP